MANVQSCFKRYEKKYRLTPAQQQFLLNGMREHMTADEYGAYTICSIYYDTPDWRLIRASLEKPVYKEKLRVRSYGVPADGGKVFVEVKKKYDGVVYKRRITTRADSVAAFLAGADADRYGQIGRYSGSSPSTARCRRYLSPTTVWPLWGRRTRRCGSPSTRTCAGVIPIWTCAAATTARPSTTRTWC